MPRTGEVYSVPYPDFVPDTTIESAKVDANFGDIATDLNTARPISVGGTGATTAAAALTNLGAAAGVQVVTNYDTFVFANGFFRSASGATTPPAAGQNFEGIAIVYDANNIRLQAYSLTDGKSYTRIKNTTWGAWTADAPAADSITNAMLANMAASTVKGNNTGASANPVDVTVGAGLIIDATSLRINANGVTNAMLADMTAKTVKANGGVSAADPVDLAIGQGLIIDATSLRTLQQMSIVTDASGLKLSGDAASPGNNMVYGTDASGVKGWKNSGGAAAFSVHKNGVNQTSVAASPTFTQVTFSTELFDIGSKFSANAWTPPAGIVCMAAHVQFTGTLTNPGFSVLAIYKNGVSLKEVASVIASATDANCVITVIDQANGSDVYTLFCSIYLNSGTATITGVATRTWWTGSML